MLHFYHFHGTRGVRPIWLCEELGISYDVTLIDFSQSYRATPEWRAISPTGKVPVMHDTTNGSDIRIYESGAMVQYLLARYADGRLQPTPDSSDFALYLQWCWFAEATFARPLGEIVNHEREFPGTQRIAAVVTEMQDRAKVCIASIEPVLEQQDFIVGNEFTAADIMLGYTLMLARKFVPDEFPPALARYWQRLTQRPAWLQATA